MPRRSAGLLLFRFGSQGLEVLLAHPGGPFWAKKDEGAWSIPKGEIDEHEDPLLAARREFREELGSDPPEGEAIPLEPVRQPGGKVVLAWAMRGDLDPATLKSQPFSMEWPPRSGKEQQFPEVDRAAWFPLELAERKILKGQAPLLRQLVASLGRARDPEAGAPG